ncbi:hypothetical protein OTV1_163 [Ostreococcus tauri virus 1]|jgi:hypothetical protein|uniref:hypothetical protein n=1 Tax=Ostreococcus tauri virus 1 TaxID=642926 RepID=UPI0001B5F852|nr:hypothetical protein OTV1_163 [Ostreococcus tauri virus 1]CAY39751.1 hypothetical protein OTV1_163 [Ostreococcus tauri virus 1]
MEHTHFIDKEPNKYEALTELQKQHIQSMKEEQVLDVIDRFEEAWSLKSNDFRNARELGYRQFVHPDNFDEYGNPSVNDIDLLAIKGIRDKQMTYLTNLKNHVRDLKIHKQEPNDDGITVLKRVNNIKRQIDDGYHNIRRHYMSFERVDNPTVQPQFSVLGDPTTLDAEEVENSTPFQKCLLYSLDQTYKAGYRRYKGQCCEEIRTVEGHRTRAWRPKFTIEQFVYSLAQKDDNFEVWKNFTSRGTVFRDVIDNMSKCLDAQFPEITKRRHVWSFKNGVFVGKEWIPDRGVYDCCFYSYDSQEFRCLDPTIIACKYFDQQFDDFSHLENWQDIPTPWFDSVLKYQKFEDEVCHWAYVMGGRLCFDVGELDGWQVIPFFKGIARSGKSTLITKVFKKFYENEDVGTLSNNIEKKFGLSAIKDAFMFIAPEVKGDLALEQAEFQSMVSGEDVSVAVKNKTAVSIEWNVPGVLGGNEVPNWKDNSGSVLRRILPWNFSKQVRDADPQLDEKLNRELPIILLKCVKAYLDYSNKYRDKDIWNVVPEYFKKIQKQVAMVASTLHNFLESTNIVFGKELFVPQTLFIQVFNQHCQANNLGKPKFNPDFYAGPFSSRDIEVREEVVTYKGRTYPKQPIIYGLDVVEETLGFATDY